MVESQIRQDDARCAPTVIRRYTMLFFYRGLNSEHPSYRDSLSVFCRPMHPSGTLSPAEHNLGIPGSAFSQYTSWTSERAVAEMHAVTLRSKGLLLKLPRNPPQKMDRWRWVGSPDIYGEKEVLLLGERFNCEVIIL